MADKILLRLGHCIGTLRDQRDWTQLEAAEKTGLDRSFLAEGERERGTIRFGTCT